jgi:antirestriction protein
MIKLFVTNLHLYNSGKLVGEWVDLEDFVDKGKEKLEEWINKNVLKGVGEEIFITDYETPMPGWKIDEYDSIYKLLEIEDKLQELDLDYDELLKVNFLITYIGMDIEEALEKFEDVIFYKDQTLAEVTEELAKEGAFGGIPDIIFPYIDFEALGKNLQHDGFCEYWDDDGGYRKLIGVFEYCG